MFRMAHVTDHHGYMALKKQKIQEQDTKGDFLLESEIKSTIFSGISVYITGYTDPPAVVLKQKLLQNGGKLQMWYSKAHVSHIIATNLPDAKVKLWKNCIVVKPAWILESLNAGAILPVAKYILYQTNQDIAEVIAKSKPVSDVTIKSSNVMSATTDSEFINEFYSNSRLHHIATWASELKVTVNKLRTQYHPLWSASNNAGQNRLIMHIDVDCFFVSIALRDKPHLLGKPVCVTHSNVNANTDVNSYAEIASCSYEARALGLKNGMFMGKALKLCPHLETVHYDFEQYHAASNTLYEILVRKTPFVEAVSCDEVYLDITEISQTEDDIGSFVRELRNDITAAIGCNVSAGIGKNKLIARLATKTAKPNNQFFCTDDMVSSYLSPMAISDLPGIGRSITNKLEDQGLKTCSDILQHSRSLLCNLIGVKTGETIREYAQGIDNRPLQYVYLRKSISVEINYGVRLESIKDVQVFAQNLVVELEKRMKKEDLVGSQVSLKMKVRAEGESIEPLKYMGHGVCDNYSKSSLLPTPTNDSQVIYQNFMIMYNLLSTVPSDIRGMGIHISKLSKRTKNSTNTPKVQPTTSKPEPPRNQFCTTFHLEEPLFCGVTSEEEIKVMISKWCSVEEPEQTDVDAISEYFLKTLKFGNVSRVFTLLNYLRKQVLSIEPKSIEWDAVFDAILNCVQNSCRECIGGTLPVENILTENR